MGTNWTQITTFEGLLSSANDYAPFWLGILLMIFSILLITFLPYGTNMAFISSGFLTFMIGILLAYMGLVAWKWVLGLAGIIILVAIIDALFAKKE